MPLVNNICDLTRKTERSINRTIRPLVLTREEFGEFLPALRARPHLLVGEA